MNTSDFLLQDIDSQKPALIIKNQIHTYGDLETACSRMAGELLAMGVSAHDRIGILGSNSLFWAAAYLAIMKLGAIAVPFAVTMTTDEFKLNQDFVQCKLICVDKSVRQKFAGVTSNCPLILNEVIENPGPVTWPDLSENFDINQDAAFMFTSGTTARSRVVRVTHRNIQANTNSIIQYLELSQLDRIMAVLPFYYCFGTSLLHTHLRAGGSLVLGNTMTFPETIVDLMETTQCNGLAGVPSTFQTFLRNSSFPTRNNKPLRKIQQAGGKLQDVLIRELVASQPQAKIFVMYGQTEATARLSYLPPDLLGQKLGSVGRGIPGVKLRVVNDADDDVKSDEVGEIIAQGENITPGYFGDPEATAEKFRNGALITGDLARVDEDGYIYIVDRKADFIKSFGYRVSSQQVEACILEMGEVVAAAAVGVPDDMQGEAIVVFVTVCSKSKMTQDMIIAHCRSRLPRHMMPKNAIIVDGLPMSAQGKVLKSELRKRLSSTPVKGIKFPSL